MASINKSTSKIRIYLQYRTIQKRFTIRIQKIKIIIQFSQIFMNKASITIDQIDFCSNHCHFSFFLFGQYYTQMNKHKTMMIETPNDLQQYKESSKHIQQKIQQSQQQAKLLKSQLKQAIKGFYMIVFRIEGYYWLYFFYSLATVCQTVVFFLWDMIASCINVVLSLFGKAKIKRTPFFACITLLACPIILQDIAFFDVSVLYHFFRGQNTVKLYSVGLSLMIFQLMLTNVGKTCFGKLSKIFINSDTRPNEVATELVLSFIYSLAHFFIIYLDFILFVIILNSSPNNRFLYLFGMNMSKLKTAVWKKFDKKMYKNNLIFDAKDRFYKITYSIIFYLTMQDRVNGGQYIAILQALIITSAIDYLRNLTTLALAGELTQIKILRNKLFEEYYVKQTQISRHQGIRKSLELDFTVIPYILFCFKFIQIIFKQIKNMNVHRIATYIFGIFVIITIIFRISIKIIQAVARKQKEKQNVKNEIPFEMGLQAIEEQFLESEQKKQLFCKQI